jgi:hypothetical protein
MVNPRSLALMPCAMLSWLYVQSIQSRFIGARSSVRATLACSLNEVGRIKCHVYLLPPHNNPLQASAGSEVLIVARDAVPAPPERER